MGEYRQSQLRLLAPAAVTTFALIFLIVVITSLTGGSSSGGGSGPLRPSSQRSSGSTSTQRGPHVTGRFYTVKPGDNLSSIAAKTGVPLNELEALNPSLDPQGLIAGQRVKLR